MFIEKARHRRKTFQEEYRELLREYGIVFDERYLSLLPELVHTLIDFQGFADSPLAAFWRRFAAELPIADNHGL